MRAVCLECGSLNLIFGNNKWLFAFRKKKKCYQHKHRKNKTVRIGDPTASFYIASQFNGQVSTSIFVFFHILFSLFFSFEKIMISWRPYEIQKNNGFKILEIYTWVLWLHFVWNVETFSRFPLRISHMESTNNIIIHFRVIASLPTLIVIGTDRAMTNSQFTKKLNAWQQNNEILNQTIINVWTTTKCVTTVEACSVLWVKCSCTQNRWSKTQTCLVY